MQRPSPSELKAVASIGELLARERRARLAAERRLVSMQAELLRANAALDAHARRLTEEIKPLRAEAEGLREEAGRASDEARVAERRLWDALEATPDGFAIYDPALMLVTANAGYLGPFEGLEEMRPGIAYRRVLELAADEGIVDIGMMRPADWVASMTARLDEERPEPVVLRLWDGACVRMVHRRAASGDLVALAIDVTAALDREAELEEARWRAEAASRAKSAFLANMSHELRTPLGGILGMSQLLAEEALSEDQRMQLSIIQDSGEALLRIVDDVLDLGRIEGARLALRPAPFDLREAIEEVVRMHRPVAVEHGLALSADIDRGLPARLVGDGARVRQVLSNLVGNAVKFTPEGRVTIRAVGAGTPAPGMVRLHVSVEDTGIGIEEAQLDRLWDAFEQAEADRDRRHDGAGLGLTVARRLVEMMGGEIWADSAPGQGSCFGVRIDLPIARERGGEIARERAGEEDGGGAWPRGGAGAGAGPGGMPERPADRGGAEAAGAAEAPGLGALRPSAPSSDPGDALLDGGAWTAGEREPPVDPSGASPASRPWRPESDGEPATASEPPALGGGSGDGSGGGDAGEGGAPPLSARVGEAAPRLGRDPHEGGPDEAPPAPGVAPGEAGAADAGSPMAAADRGRPDEGGAPGAPPADAAPEAAPSPGALSPGAPGRVPSGALDAPEGEAEAPSPAPRPDEPEPPAMPLFSRRLGGAPAPPQDAPPQDAPPEGAPPQDAPPEGAPAAPRPAPPAIGPDAPLNRDPGAATPAADPPPPLGSPLMPRAHPEAPAAPGPVLRPLGDAPPLGAPREAPGGRPHEARAEAPRAPEPGEPAPPPEGSPRAMRVLAAEDNRANRLILQRMIGGLDIALAFAADGAEAVAAFARQRPDLILMDISMPGMDGREATRRIRDAERASGAARVPIVAMTAHALPGDEEAIRAAGLDGYIAKPLRKALILDAILAHAPPGARPPDGPGAE